MAGIKLKVIPSSSRDMIAGWLGDVLKIKVKAAPENGRANQAVINLLSGKLGISRKDVEITGGHASANKVVTVNGFTEVELHKALGA